MEELYKFLSEYITQEELVYFAAFLGVIAALGNAYKDTLYSVFSYLINFYKNIRSLFVEVQMIPDIKKTVEESKTKHINIEEKINVLEKELLKLTSSFEEKKPYILDTAKRVDLIEKELSSNTGKSLKDIIVKIGDSAEKVEKTVSSLDFQVKRIEARQWSIMINHSDTPMFETDKEGLFLKANKAYLELVGLSLDEVKNNGWVTVIYVDDRKIVQYEWDSAIEDERVFDLKYKIQNTQTNRVFFVRCTANPVFVENELIGYIGRFLNIQEMIQDEKSNFWIAKPK